jgi:hypothetical protein
MASQTVKRRNRLKRQHTTSRDSLERLDWPRGAHLPLLRKQCRREFFGVVVLVAYFDGEAKSSAKRANELNIRLSLLTEASIPCLLIPHAFVWKV